MVTGDLAAAAEIFRFVGLFSLVDFGVLFCCLGEVCGELVDPLSSSPLPLPESTPESLPAPDAASPLGASASLFLFLPRLPGVPTPGFLLVGVSIDEALPTLFRSFFFLPVGVVAGVIGESTLGGGSDFLATTGVDFLATMGEDFLATTGNAVLLVTGVVIRGTGAGVDFLATTGVIEGPKMNQEVFVKFRVRTV